jgi:hypothetical protein
MPFSTTILSGRCGRLIVGHGGLSLGDEYRGSRSASGPILTLKVKGVKGRPIFVGIGKGFGEVNVSGEGLTLGIIVKIDPYIGF